MGRHNLTASRCKSLHMFQHETLDADSDVPYIDCQDVRITPARMVFENAFESKTFYEKFTILNRGSKAAFVRIGAASSYAFKVKTLLRGQKLCPGLTIERSVKFQCLCGSSVPTSTLPIYINGERIDYKIYVLLCSVDLKAEPATLNFDVINGGPNAAVRILSVRNDGTRSVRFNIDLGGNAMEFIVEPAKGIIQPKSTTYFRVECLSTTEGQFSKEFWIKCETPLRVGMVGKIIRPQLQVIHENALRHFTFIDFPKTYVGTSTSKLFLIKNFSSLPGIYCILAEVDDTIVDLRYASRKQADFQNFSVKQVEGIMEKFESRIVEVTYTPSKSKRSASKAYTFCCLRIMRVPCGTQRVTDLKEKLFSSERNTSVRQLDDLVSISSEFYAMGDSEESLLRIVSPEKLEGFSANNSNNIVRVVLFGESLEPSVKVAPKSFETAWATIHNGSNVDIFVNSKCSKSAISFSNTDVTTVKSASTEHVQMYFTAGSLVGRFSAIVDFVINASDVYSISVTAEIVPRCVKLAQVEIRFTNEAYKFAHISNPVNVPVHFFWKVPESQFAIYPMSATIASRGNITCCITYTPNRLLSNCIDATLCSENGHRQIVNITRSPCTDPKVKLESTLLRFDYIPVNLPLEGTTALINLEKEPIAFVVLNSQPIDGVNVSPVEGIIPPCGEQVLTIHIRIPTCISFEITVCIGINNDKVLELKITGKVLYPEIVCKPEVVKLKKIVAHAFERQVLIINNKSAVNATVQFCLDEYVEYHIFDERSVDLSSQAITEITLLPKSQKELYLHFNPMGAAVYCFYLPMVVNGIFGPTFLNAPETLNPAYFTKSKTESYANLDYVNIVQIPKKMPVCLVSTTVGCDTLKFTKMNVSFKYYPGDLHSETEADIKIWNASQDTCTFCIRTDNLGKPFTLQHQSGNRLELKEYSMVCQLDPQEDVTLHATFRPTFEGTYFIKLPIYLRHYASGSIFNYLSFTGYYPKPVISTNPGTIYFEPVVPTCQTEQVVTLTTRYHNMGCNISVSSNLGELKAQFGERRANHGNGEVDVILTCSAKKSTIIDGHIDVSCSCGALLKLAIKGLVENTLPTIHALLVPLRHESISFNSTLQMDAILDIDAASSSVSSFVQEVIVNYNETCFPRFPDEDDGSEYAVHMRRVCLAMEEWISHQGLYGKKYFKIPEGIAAPPHMSHSEEKQGNGSKKSNSTSLKYIDLLLNLIGSTSLKYINIRSLPDDYLERVNTIYNTYEQVIEFVTVQGGLLPHVSPEHLLVYGDYVSFYRDIFPNRSDYIGETVPKTLTNSEFYRLSKQSWLDLLLQSYKVFVLAKVQAPTKERPKSVNTSDVVSASIDSCGTYKPSENSDFWNSFADLDSSNFYQKSEMILLYWLEYHYNNVIDTHWLDFARHSHQPIPKKISNFDYDLRDGLALIAVTISYCHYLTPFFSDIYLAPTSEEQALHNASKLLESWNEINLSYSILPRQITLPNCIEMLMLVNYLFEVLPSYSAHNVLYFKTGLSTTCSKEIEVENASEALVGYAVILLGNNRDLFQINEHEIELAPFGKAKLRITFSAKFLEEERATLILNGESCRKPHAKSMAFQLVGEAVRSYCTSVINIPVPIYKIAELELSVQSPYGSAATYHINYSYDEPIDDSVGIISAQVAQNRRIPRAITCSDVLINFDDEGIGSYRINACCITTSKTSTWVIFTNSTFGNFTINIIIMPQFHDDLYCNLEVPLGTIFRKANCTCKNGANLMNKGCPRRIPLKIPCRNDFLWNALSDLVLGTADETEIDFWKRYIGTTAGIEIQKWLMKSESDDEEFKAIRSVFRSTKKYSITVESSLPQIIVPPYTSIGNVFHWDNHEIFIHMDYERQLNSDLKIKLESIDGHEYRFYNISFST
ncbi:uncharacterized protein LOC116171024 isoform X5 [Photinus pyralis]|uniref:uncharacterized protein LOC116171024 isoform X5 n=1 Tax=Photinus pyralis TaxID=7054 RepID=UPI001266F6DD|nr:uncharacterized protein LOC116171024 isoform X5 [Photinus pyralis]